MTATLDTLIDISIGQIRAGISSNEDSISRQQVEMQIHLGRNVIIANKIKDKRNGTRVHPSWVQTYFPDYDIEENDGLCTAEFDLPSPIYMDLKRDGLMWVGNAQQTHLFTRVYDYSEYMSMMQSNILKRIIGRKTAYIYADGRIKIIGDKLTKNICVGIVAMYPTEIPSYNRDVDQYPIDTDTLSMVQEYVLGKFLARESVAVADTSPDGKTNSMPTINK